jgi:hypothetical protein
MPEWARDDVAPSAAGGAHATATSPTSWRKKAEADKQAGQDAVNAAASAAPDDEDQVLSATPSLRRKLTDAKRNSAHARLLAKRRCMPVQ